MHSTLIATRLNEDLGLGPTYSTQQPLMKVLWEKAMKQRLVEFLVFAKLLKFVKHTWYNLPEFEQLFYKFSSRKDSHKTLPIYSVGLKLSEDRIIQLFNDKISTLYSKKIPFDPSPLGELIVRLVPAVIQYCQADLYGSTLEEELENNALFDILPVDNETQPQDSPKLYKNLTQFMQQSGTQFGQKKSKMSPIAIFKHFYMLLITALEVTPLGIFYWRTFEDPIVTEKHHLFVISRNIMSVQKIIRQVHHCVESSGMNLSPIQDYDLS